MNSSRFHLVSDVPILRADQEPYRGALADVVQETNRRILEFGDWPKIMIGFADEAIGWCDRLSIKTNESGDRLACCDMYFWKEGDTKLPKVCTISAKTWIESCSSSRLALLESVTFLLPISGLNGFNESEKNEPEPTPIVETSIIPDAGT